MLQVRRASSPSSSLNIRVTVVQRTTCFVRSRSLHPLRRVPRTSSVTRVVTPIAVSPRSRHVARTALPSTLPVVASAAHGILYSAIAPARYSEACPTFRESTLSAPRSPHPANLSAPQSPQLASVSAVSSPGVCFHSVSTPSNFRWRGATRCDVISHGAKLADQQCSLPLTPSTVAASSDDELETLASISCSGDEKFECQLLDEDLVSKRYSAKEALRSACAMWLQEDCAHRGNESARRCMEDLQQSPAYQLRTALSAAWAAGLGSDDDLVSTGERLVHAWETQLEATWANLRDSLAQAQAVQSSRTDVSQLSEIKERLSSTLLMAMDTYVIETELQEIELHVAKEQRRRIHNMIEDAKGQIRVYCRVRPLSGKEHSRGDRNVLEIIDDMSLSLPNGNTFACDGIYAPGSQEQIFEDCRDLVQSAVDGQNATVFSYGNTGAGKTYTMYGNNQVDGIAQRTIREVFKVAMDLGEDYSVKISASMLELYNGRLIDLLPLRGESQKLRIRHEGAGAVRVDGLQEHVVSDESELLDMFLSGKKQRIITGNSMNLESSRSHVIFTLKIETINHHAGEVLSGKIVLCDLGGSEQLRKTEVSGPQMKEAIELNRSLTALGDVIHAVATRQKSIPYRNHKLTQLLQDSIGGSAKTLMFVNCSPAASNINQTIMSLSYAARVKAITNSGRHAMISPPSSRSSMSSASC